MLASSSAYSQGCSDAGFCTMGAMQPDQNFNKNIPIQLRSVSFTLYEGQALTSPSIKAAILDLTFRAFKKYDLQVKLPYMSVSGNFGQTSGIGDISLAMTQNVKSTPEYNVMTTVGLKIPTGKADRTVEGRDMTLPMYYQTSLGTFDLVMGASYISRDWLFSAGYQQPLLHFNENDFQATTEDWSWYEGGMDYVREHAEAIDLRRGADIMFRAERNFRMSRFNFNVGLLPIIRVSRDQGKNEQGEYEKLDGTRGLALSGLIGAGYRFNVYSGLSLITGFKITDREYNPDGLTRKHVINLSYTYNF